MLKTQERPGVFGETEKPKDEEWRPLTFVRRKNTLRFVSGKKGEWGSVK